jgi:GNAT superfamily N-acetyltransferase
MNNASQLFEKMIKQLRSDPKWIKEDYGCTNIFVGDIMSVHESLRGLGLGSLLLQQSMQIATEMGCELYVSTVSTIYSQAIYKNLVRHI